MDFVDYLPPPHGSPLSASRLYTPPSSHLTVHLAPANNVIMVDTEIKCPTGDGMFSITHLALMKYLAETHVHGCRTLHRWQLEA